MTTTFFDVRMGQIATGVNRSGGRAGENCLQLYTGSLGSSRAVVHEIADFLYEISYFFFLRGAVRLSKAIGELLLDSAIWRLETAQSQLGRQVIHRQLVFPGFMSKPASDCDDPAFIELRDIELGESPSAAEIVLLLL